MIGSAADSNKRRFGPLTVIVGAALIAAAQAQAQQQPAYPAPAQSYPSAPPAYPNPSYPAPNPTYPSPAYPNPAYPNPAYPNPAYPPQQPGYPNPNPAYPGSIQQYPGYPGPPPPLPQPSHFFRDLFVQTLAVVMQTTSIGLLGTIAGRIMGWFTRKGYNPSAVPNGAQARNIPTPRIQARPTRPPRLAIRAPIRLRGTRPARKLRALTLVLHKRIRLRRQRIPRRRRRIRRQLRPVIHPPIQALHKPIRLSWLQAHRLRMAQHRIAHRLRMAQHRAAHRPRMELHRTLHQPMEPPRLKSMTRPPANR